MTAPGWASMALFWASTAPEFGLNAHPDPAFDFDADPSFHFDADPNPTSKIMRISIWNTAINNICQVLTLEDLVVKRLMTGTLEVNPYTQEGRSGQVGPAKHKALVQ